MKTNLECNECGFFVFLYEGDDAFMCHHCQESRSIEEVRAT